MGLNFYWLSLSESLFFADSPLSLFSYLTLKLPLYCPQCFSLFPFHIICFLFIFTFFHFILLICLFSSPFQFHTQSFSFSLLLSLFFSLFSHLSLVDILILVSKCIKCIQIHFCFPFYGWALQFIEHLLRIETRRSRVAEKIWKNNMKIGRKSERKQEEFSKRTGRRKRNLSKLKSGI